MIVRMWCILFVALSMMLSVVGCSPSGTPTPTTNLSAPPGQQLSAEELLKLYDPSSLVETKTLGALPQALQLVLGVHATGYDRLADVGEPCNPTDYHHGDPGRCFFVGGVSPTSALVAFKIGGIAGQSGVGEAFVQANSTWIKVHSWDIRYPRNLKELREMTRVPPDDRRPGHTFGSCFGIIDRIVNGKCPS
jgi:hypothetical protein